MGTHRGQCEITYAEAVSADRAVSHMDRGQIDGSLISVFFKPVGRQYSRSLSRTPPPYRRPTGPSGGFQSRRGGFGGGYRGNQGSRFKSRSPPGRRSRSRMYSKAVGSNLILAGHLPFLSASSNVFVAQVDHPPPRRRRSLYSLAKSRSRSPAPRRGAPPAARRPSPPTRGKATSRSYSRSRSMSRSLSRD